MNLIYHGCMFKNADGRNETNLKNADETKCFWKDHCYVSNRGVKTRLRTKNEPTVCYKDFDDYLLKREWINRWVLGKEEKKN